MAIQAQLYPENIGFSLGGSQNWMENTYGFNEFCFNLQQKQQQQQQLLQNLQQKTLNPCFDNIGLLSKNNNHQSTAFSHSIAAQVEKKQGQQIDRFISLQNERLRLLLQEQRRQQVALLLRKYEEKTVVLLKQKEEEIAKARNRTMELEDFLRKIDIESQTWYRLAKENEAMVENLNNTIEQLKENGCFTNEVEDTESCYRGEREEGAGENRGQGFEEEGENQEQIRGKKMICKSCNSRTSCVVLLPCRHICSCKDCQVSLDSCPVCGMVKKASIEVLI